MKFHYKNIGLSVIAASLLYASSVQAHSDDYFDANPSPHGGQVRMSGAYHFELLMNENEIVVFVTDHGNQPIATSGASGKLEISSAGKKTIVDLAPAEGNLLKSASPWIEPSSPEITAHLSVTFPNKKPAKAKFIPFAKRRN
jgi:hypothetical protein